MRTNNYNASYDEAKRFVEFAMEGLLPAVEKADAAIELYYKNPSVKTYINKSKSLMMMNSEIVKTRDYIWKVWKDDFKGLISAYEYSKLMDEALKKLRPEGENVGKGINGKDVK